MDVRATDGKTESNGGKLRVLILEPSTETVSLNDERFTWQALVFAWKKMKTK